MDGEPLVEWFGNDVFVRVPIGLDIDGAIYFADWGPRQNRHKEAVK